MDNNLKLENIIIQVLDKSYSRININIENGYIKEINYIEENITNIKSNDFFGTVGFVNSRLHPNQLLDRRRLDNLSIDDLLSSMHTNFNKTDENRYYQALFILIDALMSGTTNIYAVATNPFPVIKAFQKLNLMGAVSCFFNDVWEGVGLSPKQTNISDVEKLFKELYTYHNDNLKIHIGTASLQSASNDLLILLDEIAKKYNTKVNLHVSEGIESVESCRKKRGTTPIRLLSKLGVLNPRWNLIHATSVDTEEVQMIAESGASVIHCPVSNAKTMVGVAPVLDFIKYNVNIGLGTDACSNNNTNNILSEAYFALLLQNAVHQKSANIKEDDIFKWITSNGLKIMGFPVSPEIKVGARADILLWALNERAFVPLSNGKLKTVLINNAPDVKLHTVIIEGKKVVENYSFKDSFFEKEINSNTESLSL